VWNRTSPPLLASGQQVPVTMRPTPCMWQCPASRVFHHATWIVRPSPHTSHSGLAGLPAGLPDACLHLPCLLLVTPTCTQTLYQRAQTVKSAIPHPRIMGIIRECGGKMHMHDQAWSDAATDFFEVRQGGQTAFVLCSATCSLGCNLLAD
jgi:hypothetical protein